MQIKCRSPSIALYLPLLDNSPISCYDFQNKLYAIQPVQLNVHRQPSNKIKNYPHRKKLKQVLSRNTKKHPNGAIKLSDTISPLPKYQLQKLHTPAHYPSLVAYFNAASRAKPSPRRLSHFPPLAETNVHAEHALPDPRKRHTPLRCVSGSVNLPGTRRTNGSMYRFMANERIDRRDIR